MAKRTPLSERPALFRDPADWARDFGWVSRRKALNIAAKIESVAVAIEGALGEDDDGAKMWTDELRKIAKQIAPAKVPAEKKSAAREVAAMREP